MCSSDLVQALEYTASCPAGTSAAFNLGSGTGFTVRQVLDSITRISGKNVPTRTGARRPGDSAALVADPVRARDVLGWTPQLSDIDTIVRTALAWTNRREAA